MRTFSTREDAVDEKDTSNGCEVVLEHKSRYCVVRTTRILEQGEDAGLGGRGFTSVGWLSLCIGQRRLKTALLTWES
jgi:hypothetical protein